MGVSACCIEEDVGTEFNSSCFFFIFCCRLLLRFLRLNRRRRHRARRHLRAGQITLCAGVHQGRRALR